MMSSLHHCLSHIYSSISYQDGEVLIEPTNSSEAQTFVNGALITSPTVLHHVRELQYSIVRFDIHTCAHTHTHTQGDRVVVGGEHYFRLNHPLDVERGGAGGGVVGTRGFEFARNELIKTQTARCVWKSCDLRNVCKELTQHVYC